MKKSPSAADELRTEYDFSKLTGGVRGKYFQAARTGSNIVVLDPEVSEAFPSAAAVNRALRMLLDVAKTSAKRKTSRVRVKAGA